MDRRMKNTLRLMLAAGSVAAAPGIAMAQVSAAPTKANGDYIAGTGILANNFQGDVADAAAYIKPRGRDSSQPIALSGDTYTVLSGASMSNPSASWWSLDFQFTPRVTDTVAGTNYNLTLLVDIDPTAGVNNKVVSLPLFDSDTSPVNSLDDNDGFKLNPGPGLWSNDLIDYVFSQSWRPDFGFLAGAILPTGDYEVSFSAVPRNGSIDSATVATSALVRVVSATEATVTLDTPDRTLNGSQTQIVVEINLNNAQDIIAGGQFFLSYDTAKLDFVSAQPGDAPFFNEILEDVNETTGQIDYGVGLDLGGVGTDANTTMARLTFNLLGDFCVEDALVAFRVGPLPTRLTDALGTDIIPETMDLPAVTRDSIAPTIAAPPDLTFYADAGVCSATLDITEGFDSPVLTSATQAPGVWYTDRYAPATFESAFFDGDNRLQIGVSSADSAANRPPSFASTFYNTQGRKYDVDIPVGHKWSAKIYLDSGYNTQVRSTSLWATTLDSQGGVSGFPILGFVSNDPADALNTNPANPQPRFQFFTQDTDQNPANGYTAGYINLGLPSGFSDNRWWTLEIEMTNGAYLVRVIDDTNGTVLSYIDTATFGSIRASNLIVQSYNFGEDYDTYWDDVVTAPAGAIATDACGPVTVTYARSDNPALSLLDPFPAGATTTVTWTATDSVGNSSTDTQTVTVDGASILEVAVQLQSVVEAVPFDRCITFEFTPTGGGAPIVVNEVMTFTAGIGVASIEVPCGSYECLTARDQLHTLRRTDNDDFGISGPVFVADFTSSGGPADDSLIGGNLNNDTFIDILDFGVFIGQFGTSPGASTTCGTAAPHADVTGDGVVGVGDFTFIQINFLEFAEVNCSGFLLQNPTGPGVAHHAPMPAPVESIDVDDLAGIGMADLAQADLNADGVLDARDVTAFLGGARPDRMADLDANGRVDFFDLSALLGNYGQAANEPLDMNGDGRITIEDIHFVRDRMGMTFGQ